METNLFVVYQSLGNEIINLSNSKTDDVRLRILIEEFEAFASIPEAREHGHQWIQNVEKTYKSQGN